jgi:translation initiation factor 2 subunit 2
MDYEDMLDRAIEESPDIEGTNERLTVPDPDVRQEGNATVFENFQGICDTLGREPEHLMKYVQTELGTSGHIDESDRARLTGSFDSSRLADAIDAYTEEFVTCSECGLPDTRIEHEKGVPILRCEACGARSATSS